MFEGTLFGQALRDAVRYSKYQRNMAHPYMQAHRATESELYSLAIREANAMRKRAYMNVPLFRANEAMFTHARLSEKREGIPNPYYMKLAGM